MHIGRALHGNALAGVDITESFRASVVLSVSALDSYVHNLCVEGIIESFANARLRNCYFGEVRVRLIAAEMGLQSGSSNWLEGEVRNLFSRDTFQRPDDISKALRFVDDRPKKWARISARLGSTSESAKAQLNSIVDRRNMIVHEADIDPVWGGSRSLTPDDTEVAIDFISRLVAAIDDECWQAGAQQIAAADVSPRQPAVGWVKATRP